MRHDFGIYMLTFILVIGSISIIPKLFKTEKDLLSQTNIFLGSKINSREYTTKSLRKKTERTLIIILDNGGELQISGSEYGKYFKILNSKKNIGKEIKFYENGNVITGINPVQIEIDNKIVYNKNHFLLGGSLLIILTIICCINSIYLIWKKLKSGKGYV